MSTKPVLLTILASAHLISACGSSSGDGPPAGIAPPAPVADFDDVSAANLPAGVLGGMCMDADHGDVDGDGDTDIVLAQEFATNIVLLNDGAGVFSLSAGAVNGGFGDNEEVRLVDFDGDLDLDMLTVHEDDAVHSLLANDGLGIFTSVPGAIPVNSVGNASEVIDLDGNTRPDILLGNNGQNIILLQLANGSFVDDTVNRPIGAGTTQDLLLLDVEGDGDQDLLVANELDNRLLINDGAGFFADESNVRLPGNDGETREADTADVDNDGDLDIILGNVNFVSGRPIENQLLLNDGTGTFTDATASNLGSVSNQGSSFTIRFFDIDADGDPDVLSPRNTIGQGGSIDVWINDGSGAFVPAVDSPFSSAPSGSAFDIEIVDVNADGRDDIYFCYRSGTDQLYISN